MDACVCVSICVLECACVCLCVCVCMIVWLRREAAVISSRGRKLMIEMQKRAAEEKELPVGPHLDKGRNEQFTSLREGSFPRAGS